MLIATVIRSLIPQEATDAAQEAQVVADGLSEPMDVASIETWAEHVFAWIRDSGPNLALKALVFILVLFVFWIVARLVKKVVRRALSTSAAQFSELLESTVISLVGKTIMLFGFLAAFSAVGVHLGPVLAGLGIAGFVLGFALQDTLSNFAAGAMILIYNPFDVGDFVQVGGVTGKVDGMGLVSTTILTVDNQRLIVPNGKIWGDVIQNVTAEPIRRVDMVFGIGYSDDIPKAEGILEKIVREHSSVLDDPEPVIKLYNLGDSSVDFVVRPWCRTEDYWDVLWDITRSVKLEFDAAGVSIPFPQRDVHLFEETPATTSPAVPAGA